MTQRSATSSSGTQCTLNHSHIGHWVPTWLNRMKQMWGTNFFRWFSRLWCCLWKENPSRASDLILWLYPWLSDGRIGATPRKAIKKYFLLSLCKVLNFLLMSLISSAEPLSWVLNNTQALFCREKTKSFTPLHSSLYTTALYKPG